MAQIPYRGNTQSMAFPLLSSLSGRTVIDQAADQTFVPGVSTDGGVPVDRGVPQAFYAHNVMPSTYGWQSIGFKDSFLPFIDDGDGAVNFDNAYLVKTAEVVTIEDGTEVSPLNTRTYIALGRTGTNAVCRVSPTTKTWVAIANGQPSGITANTKITVANVNGFSYIYLSKIGCFIYNHLTDTLHERELLTLDKLSIEGIVSSNGYLLAWTPTSVAWSSVVNAEDFEPSEVSGAGGGSVQEAEGYIVTCVSTFLGFILYTSGNAISVTYSGNENFPWNFKRIPSAGGIASADMVGSEEIAGFQYAYTTNGLQRISHTRAEIIFPSVTDFLSGQVFEDYDSGTDKFIITPVPFVMRKKLAVAAGRYVIMSYGLTLGQPMTHAIVMDIAQARYGKVKVSHNQCFNRLDLEPEVIETPRESIAFLQSDGTTKTVDFAEDAAVGDSVLILGKFQVSRQRLVQIQEAEVENVRSADTFTLSGWQSLDGKDFENSQLSGYLRESSSYARSYLWDMLVGKNISLVFKGKFNIISFVIWFTLHGRF